MEFAEELELLESIRARLEAHRPGRDLGEALREAERVRELVRVKQSPPVADKRAGRAYGQLLDLFDAIDRRTLDRAKEHLHVAVTALKSAPEENP